MSNRRTFLKTAAIAGVATAGCAQTQAPAGGGRTFVLIHGAWHGGWCWQPVVQRLAARGHRVYAPSLTGLADRSHLLTGAVDVETHVTDIVNLFKWEDLSRAVLVGHSYGGFPVTGAIEKVLPQVESIVYLDAFLPDNGQRSMDFNTPAFREQVLAAVARGDVSRPVPPVSAFKILDPKNAAWVAARMTPQPTGAGTRAITSTGAVQKVAKKTYIRALGYPQAAFDGYLAKCRADPTWRTYTFTAEEAGHDIMVDAPARLAQILEEVA